MLTNCCRCRSFDNSSGSTSTSGDVVASFISKSVNFDGVDEYSSFNPAPASLDLMGDFSITAWIKPDVDAKIYARVLQSPEQGVGGWVRGYSFGLGGNTDLHNTDNNSYRLSFSIDDGTETVRFTAEPVIIPNIWSHIIAVWDDTGSTITLYVNGVNQILYPGPAVSYTGVTNLGFIIGWNGPADVNYIWKGNICDLAIINRKITDIEAANLAVKNVDMEAHSINDQLISWWKLGDGDTHPILIDTKGSNNLTMINMEAVDIQNIIPFPNNPSPHAPTHNLLNTDPLSIQAGGIGYPILFDHFMIQSTGSLNLGNGWGTDYSDHQDQIRWYGSEAGHPGVVTLDTYGLTGANIHASILYGGEGTIWNYVIDAPHIGKDPDPGPLTMEWLVKFSRITTTQIERAVFGWGDRYITASPLVDSHNNGFYIEFNPSITDKFRLIATKTTGGTVTNVVTGTTSVAVDTWYKISAILRYEILTSGATTYSPKISLLINDITEGSMSSVTALPNSSANIGFGARFDGGTAPVGTQDAGNNYKTPTVPYVGIDWVSITQITAGPGASITTPPA